MRVGFRPSSLDKDVCVVVLTDTHGRLHSPDNDTPAIITKNGAKFWFYQGKVHRTKGPAIIDAEGNEQFVNYGNVLQTVVGDMVV